MASFRRHRAAAATALSLLLATLAVAGEECVLRGGETIVFFGDSITQGGAYVEYVEAFLRARFPDKRFRLINSGISSETISGTSEADHQPRRPWAHERFARDVAAYKPHLVVACFGMNDGNYHPFDRGRFGRFQAGVRLLVGRTRQLRAQLVLMTPPPFDPYRRKAADTRATEFGYKFPAIDYDHTLEVYSQWIVTLRGEGLLVADVHGAMNDHLRARRRTKVSFFLSPDGIHPDATGHWLMAQTLLETLRLPAVGAEVEIDALRHKVLKGQVADLVVGTDASVAFAWMAPLPMPMDAEWDRDSIRLADVANRLNRYTLKVTGLTAKRYRLEAEGTAVGEAGDGDLARGLDLTALEKFPANLAATHVLGLVQRRRRAIYQAWRKGIASPEAGVAATEQAEKDAADLDATLRRLCQPRPVRVRLVPLK